MLGKHTSRWEMLILNPQKFIDTFQKMRSNPPSPVTFQLAVHHNEKFIKNLNSFFSAFQPL